VTQDSGSGADAGSVAERWQHARPVPAGYARGAAVPWWGKLGLKLGLAALGISGARARALGIAEPSFTILDPDRVLGSPRAWAEQAGALLGRTPRTVLEVGPGRMVVRAPALAALGYTSIWYLDTADSAPRDLAPYRATAAIAAAAGLAPPDLDTATDRDDVLRRCGASLLTGGAEALDAVPDGSVDLVVSEVALEHVRREAMAPLLRALRRVTAPDGVGLHGVEFHDHLGGGLQHLRFSDRFWARPLVGRAGLYVNRLGLSAVVGAFEDAGFAVAVPRALVWPRRPAGPARPHVDARRPADDDRVCHAELVVRPAGPATGAGRGWAGAATR